MAQHTEARRFRPTSAAVVVAVVLALFFQAPAASAAQSSTWGWTTDSVVMSFFGGIPYRGCEKAQLRVPNSGNTGTVRVTTWTSVVVGFANCTSSTPSALNANTIRTRAQVTRNGVLQVGCDTSLVYNANGQGLLSVTDTCSKTSSADATWTLLGTYGWWDYDDWTWRGEVVAQPVIVD